MFRNLKGRRAACLLTALALTAGVMSACSSGPSTEQSETKTMNIGLSDQVVNLPVTTAGTAASLVTTLIHRGLTTFDSEGKVTPGLAESFTKVNEQTYEFKLHKGLVFDDGTAVTPAVVKASLEYGISPKSGSKVATALAPAVKTIETEGDTTVRVNLNYPFDALPEYLATPGMVVVPSGTLAPNTSAWVGAGPFKIVSHDDTSIKLVKSDTYYSADKVQLTNLNITFYKDSTARTNALLDGTVDWIDYVASQDIDRLKQTTGLAVDEGGGAGLYLTFNLQEKPLADPRVRQAIALAINRENIVKVALNGHGSPLLSVLDGKQELADPALAEAWKYDPEQAKKLLNDAGYPDGFKTTFLTTAQYSYHQEAAVSIQSDLSKIGIVATLDNPDFASRMDKGAKGTYGIQINGNFGAVNDPSYLLDWVSGSPNGTRSYGFDDPELTSTLQQANKSTGEAKKDLFFKAQKMIVDKVPFTALVDRVQAFGHTDRLTGFKVLPSFLSKYSGYTLAEVRLD